MDKNFDNNLNAWLSAIVGLNAIIAVITIGHNVWELASNKSTEIFWYSLYDIIMLAFFIYGCIKLFFASKTGFYIITAVCLLNAATGGWMYYYNNENGDVLTQQIIQSSALSMIWNNIGKIIFLMLLMLLKDKGKNAYQVLWNKN